MSSDSQRLLEAVRSLERRFPIAFDTAIATLLSPHAAKSAAGPTTTAPSSASNVKSFIMAFITTHFTEAKYDLVVIPSAVSYTSASEALILPLSTCLLHHLSAIRRLGFTKLKSLSPDAWVLSSRYAHDRASLWSLAMHALHTEQDKDVIAEGLAFMLGNIPHLLKQHGSALMQISAEAFEKLVEESAETFLAVASGHDAHVRGFLQSIAPQLKAAVEHNTLSTLVYVAGLLLSVAPPGTEEAVLNILAPSAKRGVSTLTIVDRLIQSSAFARVALQAAVKRAPRMLAAAGALDTHLRADLSLSLQLLLSHGSDDIVASVMNGLSQLKPKKKAAEGSTENEVFTTAVATCTGVISRSLRSATGFPTALRTCSGLVSLGSYPAIFSGFTAGNPVAHHQWMLILLSLLHQGNSLARVEAFFAAAIESSHEILNHPVSPSEFALHAMLLLCAPKGCSEHAMKAIRTLQDKVLRRTISTSLSVTAQSSLLECVASLTDPASSVAPGAASLHTDAWKAVLGVVEQLTGATQDEWKSIPVTGRIRLLGFVVTHFVGPLARGCELLSSSEVFRTSIEGLLQAPSITSDEHLLILAVLAALAAAPTDDGQGAAVDLQVAQMALKTGWVTVDGQRQSLLTPAWKVIQRLLPPLESPDGPIQRGVLQLLLEAARRGGTDEVTTFFTTTTHSGEPPQRGSKKSTTGAAVAAKTTHSLLSSLIAMLDAATQQQSSLHGGGDGEESGTPVGQKRRPTRGEQQPPKSTRRRGEEPNGNGTSAVDDWSRTDVASALELLGTVFCTLLHLSLESAATFPPLALGSVFNSINRLVPEANEKSAVDYEVSSSTLRLHIYAVSVFRASAWQSKISSPVPLEVILRILSPTMMSALVHSSIGVAIRPQVVQTVEAILLLAPEDEGNHIYKAILKLLAALVKSPTVVPDQVLIASLLRALTTAAASSKQCHWPLHDVFASLLGRLLPHSSTGTLQWRSVDDVLADLLTALPGQDQCRCVAGLISLALESPATDGTREQQAPLTNELLGLVNTVVHREAFLEPFITIQRDTQDDSVVPMLQRAVDLYCQKFVPESTEPTSLHAGGILGVLVSATTERVFIAFIAGLLKSPPTIKKALVLILDRLEAQWREQRLLIAEATTAPTTDDNPARPPAAPRVPDDVKRRHAAVALHLLPYVTGISSQAQEALSHRTAENFQLAVAAIDGMVRTAAAWDPEHVAAHGALKRVMGEWHQAARQILRNVDRKHIKAVRGRGAGASHDDGGENGGNAESTLSGPFAAVLASIVTATATFASALGFSWMGPHANDVFDISIQVLEASLAAKVHGEERSSLRLFALRALLRIIPTGWVMIDPFLGPIMTCIVHEDCLHQPETAAVCNEIFDSINSLIDARVLFPALCRVAEYRHVNFKAFFGYASKLMSRLSKTETQQFPSLMDGTFFLRPLDTIASASSSQSASGRLMPRSTLNSIFGCFFTFFSRFKEQKCKSIVATFVQWAWGKKPADEDVSRADVHRWVIFMSLVEYLARELGEVSAFIFPLCMGPIVDVLSAFRGDNSPSAYRKGLTDSIAELLRMTLRAVQRMSQALVLPLDDPRRRSTELCYIATEEVFTRLMPPLIQQLGNTKWLSKGDFAAAAEEFIIPSLATFFKALASPQAWSRTQREILKLLRHPQPAVRVATLKLLQQLYDDGKEELAALVLAEALPAMVEATEDDEAGVVDQAREVCNALSQLIQQDVLHAME